MEGAKFRQMMVVCSVQITPYVKLMVFVCVCVSVGRRFEHDWSELEVENGLRYNLLIEGNIVCE